MVRQALDAHMLAHDLSSVSPDEAAVAAATAKAEAAKETEAAAAAAASVAHTCRDVAAQGE